MATNKKRKDAKGIPPNHVTEPKTKNLDLKNGFSKAYRILMNTFRNHA